MIAQFAGNPPYKGWKFLVSIQHNPDSPEISQEEYDKEWEEHIKFRFSGYDDEEVE